MTLHDAPLAYLVASWSLIGLLVGSFLNVAIHRLPLEGESVGHPRRSRCPSCRTTLTWKENIPIVSWVVQRGRCRTCAWPIPWRYPLVEGLTSLAWMLCALETLPDSPGLCVIFSVVCSGLIVATFVDFDCFEIPDEVSIGGIVLAPIASLVFPSLHEWSYLARLLSDPGAHEPSRLGALTACLAGMAAGGLGLWTIGWLGSRVYGRDAMGFGDVKLLAGGGGFVGPGGVVVALMIASVVASVAGLGNIVRFTVLVRGRDRTRRRKRSFVHALRVARVAGRYVPFGPYLALGVGIALLYWNDVARLFP